MSKNKIVSKVKIEVPKIEEDKRPVKGGDIFPLLYCIIYLLAKKNSGKTVVIFNICKQCAGKNTKFIFISSTVYKDKTWKFMTDYFEEKGNEVLKYTDLYDTEDGTNVIEEFIKENQFDDEEDKQDTKELPPPKIGSGIRFLPLVPINNTQVKNSIEFPNKVDNQKAGGSKKEKKTKYVYPEYIIVLDDQGKGMRDKSVEFLMKRHRHFRTKLILSGQTLKDLNPAELQQIDYALVFPKLPDMQLKELRERMQLNIPEDELFKYYKQATEEKYNFLYIASNNTELRENFNKLLYIDE